MLIATQNAKTELLVKKSRFIAESFCIESQTSAKEIIKAQKNKYFDASHVVHAFSVGLNADVLGASDAGEPSGTAGKPILTLIKAGNFTNVLITVTRYFGGILLGTAGLVHAYSDSAKAVLSATKFEPFIEKEKFLLTLNYSDYEKIKRFFQDWDIKIISEKFKQKIEIEGKIEKSKLHNFNEFVQNLTNGKSVFVCGRVPES